MTCCFQQHRCFNSIAWEQAMRLADTGPKYPASGDAPNNNNPDEDPLVYWREYWDHESKRPYYHNLKTNKVSWTIPSRFPSRFLDYYQRLNEEASLGHKTVDHLNAQQVQKEHTIRLGEKGTDSATALATDAKLANRSLKDRIKDYGPAGFILYGTIHFLSLCVVYTAMMFGVDVAKLARSFGFDIEKQDKKTKGSLVGMWLLAIAVNKIFVPIHVMMTVALAPQFVPVVRRALQVLGRTKILP